MKNISKYIKLILGLCLAVFVVMSVMAWNDAGKLYNQKSVTQTDLKTENRMLWHAQKTFDGSNEINSKVFMLSGPEHIGTVELAENEGIEVTCSSGKAKILIMDQQGNQRFYASVTELYHEPGPAGEYEIWVIGRLFSGKVSVK